MYILIGLFQIFFWECVPVKRVDSRWAVVKINKAHIFVLLMQSLHVKYAVSPAVPAKYRQRSVTHPIMFVVTEDWDVCSQNQGRQRSSFISQCRSMGKLFYSCPILFLDQRPRPTCQHHSALVAFIKVCAK